MPAISEPAPSRQRLNIRKRLSNAIFRVPQLHLTKTRRVYQQRAIRQHEYLSRSRRVTTPAITLANRLDFLDRLPKQPVRYRRFPHSRRSQKRQRFSWLKESLQSAKSLPGFLADRAHPQCLSRRAPFRPPSLPPLCKRPLCSVRSAALPQTPSTEPNTAQHAAD